MKLGKKKKPEEEIKEVSVNEEASVNEEVETVAPAKPEVTMSPEAIESRYQAHLEKIRTGGK